MKGKNIFAIALATIMFTLGTGNIFKAEANEIDEVTVEFDMSDRSALYHGSTGFLYGAAELNVPTVDLMYGLKPSTFVQKIYKGQQHPNGDVVRTSSAIQAVTDKRIQTYFQDIYVEWPYEVPMLPDGTVDIDSYQKTVEEILYGMICENAEANDEGAFLGSDGKYHILNEEKASKYSYVLFNEPDSIWFGAKSNAQARLHKAWKQIYDAIHKIDPNAVCTGPNMTRYRHNEYKEFLKFCKENDCMPEIITWHELQNDFRNFPENYDKAEELVNTYYTDGFKPEICINEYGRHCDLTAAGDLVKWMAMLEDKNVTGCLAFWSFADSMNDIAAGQNTPGSAWWIYHWYAQMTGEQCNAVTKLDDGVDFYGLTSYDEDINMAYTIFGGNTDTGADEVVTLNNISSTNLLGTNGAANVKVYGVGFSGHHGDSLTPQCIFDGAVNAENDTITIKVDDTDEMDAYFAIITPTDKTGEKMDNVKLSTLSYEAENEELLGGATSSYNPDRSDAEYRKTFAQSGRWVVKNIADNEDGVKFTVNVPETGVYDMRLFYSLQAPAVNENYEIDANGTNRAVGKVLPFGMTVNDGETQTIYLDPTISYDFKTYYKTDIELTAGENTIEFTQINGNESGKKEKIRLVPELDKLDLTLVPDTETRNDFTIDMSEQTAFKENDGYRICVIAPEAGYYTVTGGDITIAKQSIDFPSDADSFSECSVYDIPVSNTVYLAKGANTLVINGNDLSELNFTYEKDKTESLPVVTADKMAIHGYNPRYEQNDFAQSGQVISNIGIGQNISDGERAEDNYIEFSVNAPTQSVYNLGIRYANNEPVPAVEMARGGYYIDNLTNVIERYAQIKVNDNEPETVYFKNTFAWDTFRTFNIQVELDEGENIIRIYNDNSYHFLENTNETAPNIDTVTIAKLSYDGDSVTVTNNDDGVDISWLDTLMEKCESAFDNEELYTTETLAALRTAYNAVDKTTQTTVNNSYEALKDAYTALEYNRMITVNNVTADRENSQYVYNITSLKAGTLISAMYDENGILINVSTDEITVDDVGKNFNKAVPVTSKMTNGTTKFMLWNNIDGMVPLTKETETEWSKTRDFYSVVWDFTSVMDNISITNTKYLGFTGLTIEGGSNDLDRIDGSIGVHFNGASATGDEASRYIKFTPPVDGTIEITAKRAFSGASLYYTTSSSLAGGVFIKNLSDNADWATGKTTLNAGTTYYFYCNGGGMDIKDMKFYPDEAQDVIISTPDEILNDTNIKIKDNAQNVVAVSENTISVNEGATAKQIKSEIESVYDGSQTYSLTNNGVIVGEDEKISEGSILTVTSQNGKFTKNYIIKYASITEWDFTSVSEKISLYNQSTEVFKGLYIVGGNNANDCISDKVGIHFNGVSATGENSNRYIRYTPSTDGTMEIIARYVNTGGSMYYSTSEKLTDGTAVPRLSSSEWATGSLKLKAGTTYYFYCYNKGMEVKNMKFIAD